jgi:K+/H+ antiporter YhaU regulatory subunit KhtT
LSTDTPTNLHATGVVVGNRGVVVMGPSGSGKSSLAFELIQQSRIAGQFACLVADDQLFIRQAAGRLLVTAPEPIAGLAEIRGHGVARIDHEPRAVIELDDDEARQLGAILGGAYERPKIVEELEMALGELLIEWVRVPDTSPAIGRTLAECGFRARTGITIIAILREPEPVTGAQPSDVVQKGDTLVTVGKAGQYRAFRQLLESGPIGEPAEAD